MIFFANTLLFACFMGVHGSPHGVSWHCTAMGFRGLSCHCPGTPMGSHGNAIGHDISRAFMSFDELHMSSWQCQGTAMGFQYNDCHGNAVAMKMFHRTAMPLP